MIHTHNSDDHYQGSNTLDKQWSTGDDLHTISISMNQRPYPLSLMCMNCHLKGAAVLAILCRAIRMKSGEFRI